MIPQTITWTRFFQIQTMKGKTANAVTFGWKYLWISVRMEAAGCQSDWETGQLAAPIPVDLVIESLPP